MAKVLGRVATGAHAVARGPDVVHRVRVQRHWLEIGESIELELPRNLTCASCGGGGCDSCDRSGAITMRGREEPPEIVQVTLPEWREAEDGKPNVTLRIPEQGGLPAPGSRLPRGLLLLTVVPAEQTDRGVARAMLTVAPPAPASPTVQIARPTPSSSAQLLLWVAAAVVLWLLLLVLLRLSGCG